MSTSLAVPRPAVSWTAGGAPHSIEFDDRYASDAGALHQSDAVFIAGCDLPARWADHTGGSFGIGEIGFGFGVNLLNTWRRWCDQPDQPDRGATLHYLAFDRALPDAEAFDRALSVHPELTAFAGALRQSWPAPLRGSQRIFLSAPGLRPLWLTLVLGDISETLVQWAQTPRGWIDAWYFDGFAPARNPELWSDDVFRAAVRLSRPGAAFATFSAASRVRRGLEAAGFAVRKYPGFAGKRERLAGELVRGGTRHCALGRFARISGAGLAGSALARALSRRGWSVEVVESSPDIGASQNPAAVLYPGFNDASARGELALSALIHAQRSLAPQLNACGCAILAQGRWARLADLKSVELPECSARWCERNELSERAGVRLPAGGLWLGRSGYLSIPQLVRARLDDPRIRLTDAASADAAIEILCTPHRIGLDAQIGVLHGFRGLSGGGDGGGTRQRAVLSGGGYLTPPDAEGWQWVGAAHQREGDAEAANRARLGRWCTALEHNAPAFQRRWSATR
ncbi:MAG: tRNA (5-methylaminomethyl-2-thiouridine)(34)-methyltransferase MnmD, partial [Gammaproteobacteria bacterium AqS3]|nr:tRNA (5-methylaminomethyl-2-thiouridine)(34)-methyltransferase MnmD [Gammaproteobacteria bacterium AqS3]